MVLPDSDRVSRAPSYSGTGYSSLWFRLRGSHPLRRDFPVDFVYHSESDIAGPTTPRHRSNMVWASPLSLATTQGFSVDFLSSGYLDVSVPLVRFCTLCIQMQMTGHYPSRVFPFGDLRIKAWLTAPRSISQSPTSFIAS